jgi:hypothetical protein
LLLLGLFALLLAGAAWGAPKLLYGSVESEAATEYQVGDGQFGPSYLRLIGRAEVAMTEQLTAKALVNPCLGPYSTHPKGVTECAVYRWLEELSINGVYDGFDFSIGRQVITQGNTEGFILLDRYNGRDFCRFSRLDVQNKLPNWLARGRASLSDSASLSLTFAPFSAVSYLPQAGSYCDDRFHDAGRFNTLRDPENDSLADWAGGGELAFTHDSWSATLNALSMKEDIFVLETVPAPQKIRPRTLWLGGTAAASLGPVVLRGELAFSPDRAFTLAPQAVGGLLRRGLATDGAEGRWNVLASLGLEGRNDEWYWALQYFLDRVEAGPALTRELESHLASLRVRRSFLNERLALDGFAVLDMSYSDFAIRVQASYEIDEKTQIAIGGTAYADMGGDPGLLGSYVGRESLFLKLRRTLF